MENFKESSYVFIESRKILEKTEIVLNNFKKLRQGWKEEAIQSAMEPVKHYKWFKSYITTRTREEAIEFIDSIYEYDFDMPRIYREWSYMSKTWEELAIKLQAAASHNSNGLYLSLEDFNFLFVEKWYMR